MSDEYQDWEIPPANRPKPEDCLFNLDAALASIFALRSEVPEDAFTAQVLGTERAGNGVLISADGLILTIGYLIAEAESVWLLSNDGDAIPAHVVAYDHHTGFGLVQALAKISSAPIEIGDSRTAESGDPVIMAGHGGMRHALSAWIAAKREFAGYWEYLLDEAIFTSPPHPNWGGAALLDHEGKLLGIGSLFVQQVDEYESQTDGNMIVPIDLLEPILDDLLKFGKSQNPQHPWLGAYTAESNGQLLVAGLAEDGPAESADVQVGDIILAVAGESVSDLASMLRKTWSLGSAGVEVPLTLLRNDQISNISISSSDRMLYMKTPKLH
ncbi:MAG: S1C family serine protease [Alphaproteobacteria bacterium]|jgi:S1-C subfamily serine protease|nr:S1C family serine protease [Alphaproteobacteria bacterium]|tara:strand:+ start:610 stop:1590 length:981 start_codon:yes stop_codon:yes gene_type:complete